MSDTSTRTARSTDRRPGSQRRERTARPSDRWRPSTVGAAGLLDGSDLLRRFFDTHAPASATRVSPKQASRQRGLDLKTGRPWRHGEKRERFVAWSVRPQAPYAAPTDRHTIPEIVSMVSIPYPNEGSSCDRTAMR